MYLANLCNSTIIKIYSDIIRVSHGFEDCQMLEYIADIIRLTKVLNFRNILRKGTICKKIKVLLPLLFPLYYPLAIRVTPLHILGKAKSKIWV